MASPCIFCNKPGGSAEHLWSAKLGPEIARYLPILNRSYKAKDTPSGSVDEFKSQGMATFNTTIPCVCHSCNNSWMNRLDELTRVKTIRLIRGQDASFDRSDAQYLASWLAMKMMVRDEYKGTQTAFTEEEKTNFYLTGLPPANMWIGLSLCGEPAWAAAFQRQFRYAGLDDGLEPGQLQAIYTMGLGATVAFVQFPAVGGVPTEVSSEKVLTIWPMPEAFEWPARRRLSGDEVGRIATRFIPSSESAGNLLGKSQWRLFTGYSQNRAQRRAKQKSKPKR